MQIIHPIALPIPNAEESIKSLKLIARLQELIQNATGVISFADYMQCVLYEPQLGYYNSGNICLGQDGDFVTAPEVSPLFSYCLANQCEQILTELGTGGILEIGAGSGKMALDILLAFEKKGYLPLYSILEQSAALRIIEQEQISKKAPHLLQYVRWLNNWPKTWQGVIIANEWLDALPVHRFIVRKQKILEQAVTWQQGQLGSVETEPLSKEFLWAVQNLAITNESFCSEFSLLIPTMIQKIAKILQTGAVLLIDYGYSDREYYHLSRSQGTLMCHYRQLAHSDPFIYPGLQDITAHVNFTALLACAMEAGFTPVGFSNQASFLLGCGLLKYFEACYAEASFKEQMQLSQQVKWLTMPDEMGERFWVLGLSKQCSAGWMGFSHSNGLHRL